MNEEKYFVPSITDIRVEYEAEWKQPNGEWETKVIEFDRRLTGAIELLSQKGFEDTIRTPYLTKEQIESEGWIFLHELPSGNIQTFTKDNIRASFSYSAKWIEIFNHLKKPIYDGECKDINTFRTICKLLNI